MKFTENSVVAALVTFVLLSAHAQAHSVDFAREVLPILSDKCFVCHGPDVAEDQRLRLDTFEAATADLGGYRAVDPQAPAKSELLDRIHSAEDPMPPADAEKQLSVSEREVLSRWVREGGKYSKHWAFVRPTRVNLRSSTGTTVADAIDAFIGDRLAVENVSFSDEAQSHVLARRAALVLTGLPPEPSEVRKFLADASPRAFERFVDGLLDSPRFGEHQARYWLDAVRYGDTHGLHLDNRRGIYPYRDWVVSAFNQNLPLDDFMTWQIAGDLLPSPTVAQRVATGYVRLNPSTGEGGAIPAEFQMKNNFDRVETLGTVFLGLSLTCARCHNHKYDPVTQQEYYQLLAYFNNTAEPAMDGNSYTYGPTVRAPASYEAWQAWDAAESKRAQILRSAKPLVARINRKELKLYADANSFRATNWQISGAVPPAEEPPATLKSAGDFPGVSKTQLNRGGKVIWVSFLVRVNRSGPVPFAFSTGPDPIIRVDGKRVEVDLSRSSNRPLVSGRLELEEGQHRVELMLTPVSDRTSVEVTLSDPWKFVADGTAWQDCDPADRLLMLADKDSPLAGLAGDTEELSDLVSELSALEAQFTTSLIAKELPRPRDTFVLQRGEYDKPIGDAVSADVLSATGGGGDTEFPKNRLGLARWLTSNENPLVARVLMNRIWQRVFGHALVRSPEDFGLQGHQPTHPKLLDWLAVELRESGWNLKRMIRGMVLSRTFRQSSRWRVELDDPENRLFARGPGHRLDAEVLRDISLWSSGLLDPFMGGEGVKPYQPVGMWTALAHPASNTKLYQADRGQRLYRRSLYVYWKRTSPHPMMTLFDAPDRESSCVRRSRTNTPLQSLGLLNETQRVETARALAQRLLRLHRSDRARLNWLFTSLASRKPTRQELRSCLALLETMQRRFGADEADARDLLAIGESPRDESIDVASHAAWTQLASAVLASDIAILLY